MTTDSHSPRLKKICPDETAAAIALGELLKQAGNHRFPGQDATLGEALRKYLEVADLEVSTREAHEGYIRRTIGPVLGEVKLRKLRAESLGWRPRPGMAWPQRGT